MTVKSKQCIGMVALAALAATGGVYADPLFEDAAANDFRLKSGSPALALGFEPWDYSVSGLKR